MTARKLPADSSAASVQSMLNLAKDGLVDGVAVEFLCDGLGIEYLFKMPETVPADRLVVHNHVRPQPRLGLNGFRAWLYGPNPDPCRVEVCECGWAPQFPEHYRVKR